VFFTSKLILGVPLGRMLHQLYLFNKPKNANTLAYFAVLSASMKKHLVLVADGWTK
jgi:hypothetical protein